MRKCDIWNILSQKSTQLIPSVTVLPAHLNKIAFSPFKIRTHGIVMMPIERQVFLLMSMRVVIPVRKSAAIPYRMRSHRVLLQAIKPCKFILSHRKDELASGKHHIELLVNQRPRPIFEQIESSGHLFDTSKIIPYHHVFEKTSVTTFETVSQQCSTYTQGACTSLVQSDSKHLLIVRMLTQLPCLIIRTVEQYRSKTCTQRDGSRRKTIRLPLLFLSHRNSHDSSYLS